MRHLLAALVPALALTAAAPVRGPAEAPACDISAYLTDPDPLGTNVRAAPSAQARVLQVIGAEGSGVAAITGFRGGWFRVARIDDAETDARLFEGEGWVHASLLGLDVANADPRLYAARDRRSRVLARLTPDGTRLTLIGCAGEWAQVRAVGRVGWLSRAGQCSNPLTTCA